MGRTAAAEPLDFDSARLHVVTGKGGTGKTTVAAALALALAAGGRQVLVVEVEGRQALAQLFDTPPLAYEERKVAVSPRGGDVHALAVDAEEALLEYLELFYKLGRAGKALKRFGAVDFATTVAPGLRDVLLTGKVYEATRRKRKDGRPAYDAVVLDAPPTGRITRFLNVNTELAGLARVGPIKSQADSITALLRSADTRIHLSTLLEDMPVQETCDAVAELRASRLPLGAVFVNMVRDPVLTADDLASADAGALHDQDIAAGLRSAGLDSSSATIEGLLAETREHARRVALEFRQRHVLRGLGLPAYELPLLRDGVDLGALYTLADVVLGRPSRMAEGAR